ncbi:hypothetical protein PV10_08705 [Exophiala mesophila]|uniref:Apple domain-containing protein n=1 Tax=Exophiala mesophila TaxID=212818 RepID=A0A0D1XLP8_EXOME|nr:uncharacterized protein PV10_08705 [Exophiala mesophila]KIV89101.1 hypothetical protein PV10_08705 [Exophiala mesophila]
MFSCVIVIILGLLLDLLGVAIAASATPGWEISPRGRSRAPARLSSKRNRRQKGWKKFPRRQETPTTTTTLAICDENDGSFYLGPQNYTYQLQCKTEYEGVKIGVQNTDNFEDCIGACIDHNIVNGVGTCLGATFDDHNVLNTCILWSDVSEILLVEEDEGQSSKYKMPVLVIGTCGKDRALSVNGSTVLIYHFQILQTLHF